MYYTITLLEAFVENGRGITLTLRSDLQREPEPWHVIYQTTAETALRRNIAERVTAPCRRLVVGMSVSSFSPATVLRARLTLVDEHRT